jgi:hypothetical protein
MTTAHDRIEQPAPTDAPPRAPRSQGVGTAALARAWISIALVPVFFFLAFAVGEGLIAALGYPDGDGPIWTTLVSAIAATVVVLLPCLAAAWFGTRAHRARDRRGLVPAALGAVIGLGWLVLTIVTEVNDLLLH